MAMGKKAILATVILILLLIGVQAVEVAKGNPYAFSKSIDPPSSAIPPTVTIDSPRNNTDYPQTFNISFAVKCIEYSDYFSDVQDVTYILDNQTISIPHRSDVLSVGDYATSFQAPYLASGNHSLWIRATGIAYQLFADYFIMESSIQIFFSVSDPNNNFTPAPTATLVPSPSNTGHLMPSSTLPTSPTPSATEPPTQQPKTEPSPTASPTPVAESGNHSLILEMAGVIVIVTITVVGSLVCFRKRKELL
jgi:hypothetical protein